MYKTVENLCDKFIDNKFKFYVAATTIAASFIYGSAVMEENMDLPAPFTKGYMGRTKNSLASMVAGLIASELKDNAKFSFEVEKKFWVDAKTEGQVLNGEIDSLTDLTWSSARYTGTREEAEVLKSELNWSVKQIDQHTWHVGRSMLKFDMDLILEFKDGNISGNLVRSGMHFDWKITGTYDEQGNVDLKVKIPLSTDFEMHGKVEGI